MEFPFLKTFHSQFGFPKTYRIHLIDKNVALHMIPMGPIANENTDLPFQDTTWNMEPNKKQLETQLIQGPR